MKEIIVGPDVDPMILARGTPGFSGADLQNMVKYVLELSTLFGLFIGCQLVKLLSKHPKNKQRQLH
jgi:hypothetical protein